MSIRYISTLPVLAAMAAVLAVSCARADADVSPSGEETGEAIRYEVMNSGIEGVKSSINEGKDLGEITLRSADGGYSLTLGCTATPTQDEIPAEITKGAPVTSEDIDTRYNDGSIQILAYNEGTTTEYIPPAETRVHEPRERLLQIQMEDRDRLHLAGDRLPRILELGTVLRDCHCRKAQRRGSVGRQSDIHL